MVGSSWCLKDSVSARCSKTSGHRRLSRCISCGAVCDDILWNTESYIDPKSDTCFIMDSSEGFYWQQ